MAFKRPSVQFCPAPPIFKKADLQKGVGFFHWFCPKEISLQIPLDLALHFWQA